MSVSKDRSKMRELKGVASKYPFVKEHLKKFRRKKGSLPDYVDEPHEELKFEKSNLLYKVDDQIFAHIYAPVDELKRYYALDPSLKGEEKKIYKEIKKEIILRSTEYSEMENPQDYRKEIKKILKDIIQISNGVKAREENNGRIARILKGEEKNFVLSRKTYDKVWYQLKKELIGLGPLQPLSNDKLNEDIHVLGYDRVNVNHHIYGMLRTNIDLGTEEEYKRWLETITQRIGNPISSRNPIIDSTLPDGSRLNIVYSDDISVEGPTLTIRQFEEEPLSLFEIIQYGTLSPSLVAYLWLALESNASVSICGETASGKTTTMNAITALIPRDTKIYSAEDTLEVRPPHQSWQRLLTRDTSTEDGGVDLFSLVKNALRSRPGYIIVGEVRGEEGFNVFQAMQTGHPTIFTFHAGSISSLVDRFTGDPINVPEKFFGNLDIVVFQNFIKTAKEELRRVTGVHEIEGYSGSMDGIVTRKAFERDSENDELKFIGQNNSYILENEVAPSLGYEDPREIYSELKTRIEVIEASIRNGYTSWDESVSVFWTYQEEGLEGLPFPV